MPSILTWGYGDFGIHGQGHTETQINPSSLSSLSDKKAKIISAGGVHSFVVTEDNELYSFGHGGSGQLGVGVCKFQKNPVKVEFPKVEGVPENCQIAGATCGGRHSIVWDIEGNCWVFGNNFDAQLSYDFDKTSYKDDISQPEIMRIFKAKEVKIGNAACGGKHSVFVSKDGNVFTCGLGSSGQLGHDDMTASEVPQQIMSLDGIEITRVSAGETHSVALAKNGTVYQWGSATALGVSEDVRIPQKVEIGQNETVIDVKCGTFHSIALTSTGEMYTWGCGSSGQLGTGEIVGDIKTPTLVSSMLSKVVVQIGAGERYSVALTDDSKVYVWGQNTSSVFGLIGEEKNDVIYPEPMVLPSLKDMHVMGIFSGNWHMVASTSEREVDFSDKDVMKVINNQGKIHRRRKN